ncbi:MAG: tRNA dihydrouridine synthase DusB [Clostridia bacterium]|nr:tRNA dihydrouridine synthase DusB [Clostridia bacterium]
MRIGTIELPEGAALAPMAGVTDATMRLMCAREGCAWSVSEMLSAKGYLYSPDNYAHRVILTRFPGEGIAGLQLFGSDEAVLSEAVRRLNDAPYDFFDFNMGCPARKIVANGEGSALMREPARAGRLIAAMVKAAAKPVTVKIRAGWDAEHINAVEAAKIAEDAGVAAITVHPRTRDQLYLGKSDWNVIRAVKRAVRIPVIGNGDVVSGADAVRMKAETGCDAVMIARAAEGNPWIFREALCALRGEEYAPPDVETRVKAALAHLDMQCEWRGERYAVPEMRKHVAWYLAGTPGSGILRARVNQMTTHEEVRASLIEYLNSYLNGRR